MTVINITFRLVKSIEGGFVNVRMVWQKLFLRKDLEKSSKLDPIELSQVVTLFVALFFGTIVSVLVLLVEFVTSKRKVKSSSTVQLVPLGRNFIT